MGAPVFRAVRVGLLQFLEGFVPEDGQWFVAHINLPVSVMPVHTSMPSPYEGVGVGLRLVELFASLNAYSFYRLRCSPVFNMADYPFYIKGSL